MSQNQDCVSTNRQRIAELAEQSPTMAFTSLNGMLTLAWLQEAHQGTRKDGAVGIDGQTAEDYALHLEGNLRDLLERAKSGTYRAPPVRRVEIPKPGQPQEKRPLGIPTFEDKILQRAVLMLLEPIYEHDFSDGSYGYRPGRSAHAALKDLREHCMRFGGGQVLEVDIRKFFDTLDHGHLREFLRRRIRDGVLLRLIQKWLKAGVLFEGRYWRPDAGAPQGGVISPLLANIFLHYVLDEWFATEVTPRLQGRTRLIRFADDFVIVFSRSDDAQRVWEVLPKRFAKYGLQLHPEKTRLISFSRPASPRGSQDEHNDTPDEFTFLGFTHYWDVSRNGYWVVKQKTAASRLRRSLRAITLWCKRNRHLKFRDQHRMLSRKMQGHYGYYGIRGNSTSLARFSFFTRQIWWKWLNRRNRRRNLSWSRFNRMLEHRPLPAARIVHR